MDITNVPASIFDKNKELRTRKITECEDGKIYLVLKSRKLYNAAQKLILFGNPYPIPPDYPQNISENFFYVSDRGAKLLYKTIDPQFVKDPTTGLYATILNDADADELEQELKKEQLQFYRLPKIDEESGNATLRDALTEIEKENIKTRRLS